MSEKEKKKLNYTAKAFVPSNLKSSAVPWTPPPSEGTEKKTDDKPKSKSAPAKTNANANAPAKASKESTKQSAPPAETKPEPTKAKPAAATPAPAETKPEPVAAKPAAPAPPAVIAWGKKTATSAAIRAAPTAEQQTMQQQQQQRQRPSRDQKGGNRDNRDNNNNRDGNNRDGKKGQGQWRNQKNEGGSNWRNQKSKDRNDTKNNHRNKRHEGNDQEANDGWQRGKALPLELLKPNEGKTDAEKAVARILYSELLAMRLSYVAPPLSWENKDENSPAAPEACRWVSDTRVQEIDASSKSQRVGGDVSMKRRKKQDNETAPALEDCKPLEVNNDTRWKASIFKKEEAEETDEDSDEVVLRKSLLILNKLSLTKFDKLSDKFIATGIGRNETCLAGAIELVVKKAQDEPHFAAMYAALCLKLSRTPMDFEEPGKKKRFKKMLLGECQKEFEEDTQTKIAQAIEGMEDEEEKQTKAGLIKKHYLGHMRFIGELYKGDLISIKIMLMCLPALLEGDVAATEAIDEEKVECFAKLMTVIGSSLEQQSASLKSIGKADASEKLANCWKSVEIMAGKRKEKGPSVSNRIKFMLQDLIEMKENGWIQRREEETAKTIAQIHKEAAKESRRSSSSNNLKRMGSSNNLRRQASSGDVRNIGRNNSKPSVDADGFEQVGTGGFGRSQSLGNFARTDSNRSNSSSQSKNFKRSTSGGSFAAFNDGQKNAGKKGKDATLPNVDEKKASKTENVTYKTPAECGDKAKNYFKEFFVGGDADDIVLSLHELIGAGAPGSIERGAKVIESCVLMILEMKAEELDKFLSVITRCISEKKIETDSILTGLNDPLEFLTDIAIDAPLANAHMVTVVSEFVKSGAIQIDFLLNSPEYFRTDCNSAQFGCKVLKKIGGDATTSESNLQVIEKLMTDEDKESYPDGAKALIEA